MMESIERIVQAAGTPHMIAVSMGIAIFFLIGGIVLYKYRDLAVRGLRWPGMTCAVIGCVSLISKVFQYLV